MVRGSSFCFILRTSCRVTSPPPPVKHTNRHKQTQTYTHTSSLRLPLLPPPALSQLQLLIYIQAAVCLSVSVNLCLCVWPDRWSVCVHVCKLMCGKDIGVKYSHCGCLLSFPAPVTEVYGRSGEGTGFTAAQPQWCCQRRKGLWLTTHTPLSIS